MWRRSAVETDRNLGESSSNKAEFRSSKNCSYVSPRREDILRVMAWFRETLILVLDGDE
jgi:hypothetical protein